MLVQRARAISCMCLPEEQKWPRDPFITMELWFLIVIIVNVLKDLVISSFVILPCTYFIIIIIIIIIIYSLVSEVRAPIDSRYAL